MLVNSDRTIILPISELWHSADQTAWDAALARYWDFVQPRNLELERSLDSIELERIRRFDAHSWYKFLLDEYFRWKYTAPNRYASTTRELKRYRGDVELEQLDGIRQRILNLNLTDVRGAWKTACEIRSLGPRELQLARLALSAHFWHS
jgi:hypothetical protein